ncbi:hypothetical protein WA556_006506 [Blastocystis sp. ATCC 50177/Nand II]
MAFPKSVCEISESSSLHSEETDKSQSASVSQLTLSENSIASAEDSLNSKSKTPPNRKRSASQEPSPLKRRRSNSAASDGSFDFNDWSKSQISFFNEVDNYPLSVEFENSVEKKGAKRDPTPSPSYSTANSMQDRSTLDQVFLQSQTLE